MTQIFRVAVLAATITRGACATSIVVIRNGDKIAMAADSLAILGQERIYVCKVVQVGRCFFAASGSWNPSIGFDVLDIGKRALQSGMTLHDHANAFQATAKPPMLRFIENDRRTDPEHYRKLLTDGVIDVVFFGMERGAAIVIQTGYRLNAEEEAVPFLEHSSDSDGDVFRLGQSSAVMPFLSNHPELLKLPITQQARKLVEVESDDVPSLVGGKITVISVTAAGDVWVDAGVCRVPVAKQPGKQK